MNQEALKVFKEVLKVFLEKYFIISIFASVMTGIIFLITPDEHFIRVKLGNVWLFALFTFGVFFVVLFSIVQCWSWFKNKITNKAYEKQQNEKNEKACLEKLWRDVDCLSNDDYKILMIFMNNGNQPIIKEDVGMFYGGRLLNSEYVHSTIVKNPEQNSEDVYQEYRGNIRTLIRAKPVKRQYKLKQEFYKILKYSQEKYGRISNFQR